MQMRFTITLGKPSVLTIISMQKHRYVLPMKSKLKIKQTYCNSQLKVKQGLRHIVIRTSQVRYFITQDGLGQILENGHNGHTQITMQSSGLSPRLSEPVTLTQQSILKLSSIHPAHSTTHYWDELSDPTSDSSISLRPWALQWEIFVFDKSRTKL